MAAIANENGASTSQSTVSDFDQTDIDKLMATGKKLYTTKDIQGACDIFGDICAKLAERYGQTADECGEAYLCYGKSLLDIARSESDVLGSSVNKVEASTSQVKAGNEESEEEITEREQMLTEENGTKENGHEEKMDEDDEKESEVEERENEKEDRGVESEEKENEQDNDNTESDEKDVSEDDKKEIVEGEETSENDEQTGENEANEEGDEEEGDEDEGENEEEVSTMQQAWEILELCRIVFARHETKEHKLKQAEANLLLGEIGMEQEHYPEAVGDFMECLRIQERYLEPNDRLLAMTFYNLGLAYSFDRHYGKAIEYFNKAVDVIRLRIDSLKKDSDESSKSSELKELEELLPEMMAKIEDAEYMKKSTEEIVRSAALIAKESLESSSFDEPTMDTNKEGETEQKVNNISSLVRKKRKTDDVEGEAVPKKAKEVDQVAEGQ